MENKQKKRLLLGALCIGFLMLTGFAPSRMVVNHFVNVRTMPTSRSEKLGSLEAGEVVQVTGKTENGWYKINYGEQPAYVSGNYLTALPLKINALGDSITQGAVVFDNNNLYFNVVGILCGAEAVRNYGANGTTISGIMPTNFVDRSLFMDKDANLIFVLGGTNDFYYNVPLGTNADTTYFSFYGSLHLLCQRLQLLYPQSDIVFLTPLKRADEFGMTNTIGLSLENYVAAIQDVCGQYGIPVVDLYHEPQFDYEYRTDLYMPDGLHLDDLAHMELGHYITEKMVEMGIVYDDQTAVK